jgi:hypothetical protein
MKLPLPEESTEVAGQVAGTVKRSAQRPVISQVVMQVLALQLGVPPLAGQALPQDPQSLMVLSGVSQPFFTFPSQSA